MDLDNGDYDKYPKMNYKLTLYCLRVSTFNTQESLQAIDIFSACRDDFLLWNEKNIRSRKT